MQRMTASITTSGSTGAATGSGTMAPLFDGKLHAVYVAYASPATAGTTVRISQYQAPSVALLALVSNTADGWYFPRNVLSTGAGVAVTSTSGAYPVTTPLTIAVSTATPSTGAVTVYAYVEEQ